MGIWNSDIGFNYDDMFPCTAWVDLFPCSVNIHGSVSTHVETVALLSKNNYRSNEITCKTGGTA